MYKLDVTLSPVFSLSPSFSPPPQHSAYLQPLIILALISPNTFLGVEKYYVFPKKLLGTLIINVTYTQMGAANI